MWIDADADDINCYLQFGAGTTFKSSFTSNEISQFKLYQQGVGQTIAFITSPSAGLLRVRSVNSFNSFSTQEVSYTAGSYLTFQTAGEPISNIVRQVVPQRMP